MVRPPSRRLVSPFCLPLSLPTCVPVMVCLPDGVSAFQRSCLPLSPLVSNCLPTIYVCVGWCVRRLPKVLSLLVVFHCLPPPFLFPFLGWCAHVSPIVPHSLPLSPHMCACVGWCVLLAEVLSPIVSHCLPKWSVRLPDACFRIVSHCPPMCACVGWCVRLPEVLSTLLFH